MNRRRTKVMTAFLSCGLCLLAAATWAQFPRIPGMPGRAEKGLKAAKTLSEMEITADQEVAMGKEVAGKMVAYSGVFENRKAVDYVRKVGEAVAMQSERKDVACHFDILDSDEINAFAAPGGLIFVTRGLLEMVESEAELAGVLGHEVGHVAGRHVVKEIQRGKAMQVGADVAAEFTPGSQFLEEVAKQIVTKLITQGLNPRDENDADQRGVTYAYAAGYRPDGIKTFLEKLVKLHGDQKTSWLTRTHPPLKERVERVQRLIAERKLQTEGKQELFDRYQTTMAEAAKQ